MSNIYNLEPPTNGKVILKTTAGDIDIELWPKEAPRAVRNFVQLCLEGYYDGCIFHRILKDFLVQTGDPTGSGTGGESVYGAPFKDEFHSRLRFSHRGIVACANENRPDSNSSQFFITLGPTESLQKKHTIFGRVAGDTIYNVAEMNDLDIGEDDRPTDPPVIKEVEVLGNPFDDIRPRSTKEERLAAAKKAEEEAAAAARPAKRQKKNVALLSFGGDAEEGEEAEDGDGGGSGGGVKHRLKSAHELIEDARLVKANTEEEQRLAAEEAAEAARVKASIQARLAKRGDAAAALPSSGGGSRPGFAGRDAGSNAGAAAELDDDTEAGFDAHMRAKALAKRSALQGATPGGRDGAGGAKPPPDSDEDSDDDGSDDGGKHTSEKRRAAALAGGSKAAVVRPSRQARIEDSELLKPWELKRREYKQKRKLTGHRDKDTLAKLSAFESLLGSSAAAAPAAADEDDLTAAAQKAADEAYAGKVRTDIDHEALKPAAWRIDALQDEEDDFKGGLDSLRGHILKFPEKAKQGTMDRDMDDIDNLVVIDPLLEKGKAAWNKQQAKAKKRQTEWGSGDSRPGRN